MVGRQGFGMDGAGQVSTPFFASDFSNKLLIMDQYSVLKTIHKVGHSISGVVTGYQFFDSSVGPRSCHIEMETTSVFKSILSYSALFDDYDYLSFDETLLPAIGSQVEMVIMNYVDGTLYLSAKPSDVNPDRIGGFVDFYKTVESLIEGTIVTGQVVKTVPFGLFVMLSERVGGLIDIGYPPAEGCERLPRNASEWPQEGDSIACKILGFRFHDRQIALSWLPAGIRP